VQKDSGIAFVKWCLGVDSGFVAIGSKHYRTNAWKMTIAPYDSNDVNSLDDIVERMGRTSNMYFCPTVLRAPRSIKENITLSSVAWADLDECSPDKMMVPPTVVVETSPNRYQAYWKLEAPESALDIEEINHRIAQFHIHDGCDQGGWDLTQQLRIPGTNNYKYIDTYSSSIIVKIIEKNFDRKYSISDFDIYPETTLRSKTPLPKLDGDKSARDIIYDPIVRTRLHASAYELFENEPEGLSWSEKLWKLELLLFGSGLSDVEVFTVVKEAACNKYERDHRPEEHLWEDVCRAKAHRQHQSLTPTVYDNSIGSDDVYIPRKPLLTADEHALARQRKTFIEEYVEWAKEKTDAPTQYHEAGAFLILSGMLAGSVRIPTSAGSFRTNLWLMTLGETTLSRKSTAMKLAVDILEDIDTECILATDGSIEGILDSLATRPNRSSIYHKDEFSGLLDAMGKKDYLAGSMEHFTQLYDSQHLKRLLRTGVIDIRNPVFIMYAGGIRDRIYVCLSIDHIASGFIPRFIFVSPEVDLTNQKAIGPPVIENMQRRAEIVHRLQGIYEHYNPSIPDQDDGLIRMPRTWEADIKPEAWAVYNRIEHTMQKMAFESDVKDLMMPMMDRLAKSGLKMATLLAAAERLDEKVIVHTTDVIHAFHYIESYMEYSIEVVSNAGKSSSEMLIERMTKYVTENPGVARALLMRKYHLSSKSADGVFNTLEERGLLIKTKRHTGWAYYPQNESVEIENGNKPKLVEKNSSEGMVDFG
jgi:uncharacterized protein DUF3987/DNA primase RepB-like protein